MKTMKTNEKALQAAADLARYGKYHRQPRYTRVERGLPVGALEEVDGCWLVCTVAESGPVEPGCPRTSVWVAVD